MNKSRKTVKQVCDEFEIPRSTYYDWKKKYDLEREEGLKRKKPIAKNYPNKVPQNGLTKREFIHF